MIANGELIKSPETSRALSFSLMHVAWVSPSMQPATCDIHTVEQGWPDSACAAQVAWEASVCNLQQIWEEAGRTAADKSGNRKQRDRLDREQKAEQQVGQGKGIGTWGGCRAYLVPPLLHSMQWEHIHQVSMGGGRK